MERLSRTRFASITVAVLIGSAISLSLTVSKGQSSGTFNQPGSILITDQFNNRAIEIDPAGNIVWQFGNGPGDTSANAIVGTNDAGFRGLMESLTRNLPGRAKWAIEWTCGWRIPQVP